MFKRIMLTLTFAAAFGAAGLSLTHKAEARWGWNRPYVSYYYGPRVSYGYDVPYRTSYYRGYGYGPRPYYNAYYSDPGSYYYRPVRAWLFGSDQCGDNLTVSRVRTTSEDWLSRHHPAFGRSQ